MTGQKEQADIRNGRLPGAEINENFADLHPPLSRSEALIEADRCYFCFDAPCTTACPTGIDIPGFIQQIRSDNIRGSAHTILSENIMGGMCARVCPTEILCEQACVRNTHEEQPVRIGLLQRHATDPVFKKNIRLFKRAEDTGRTVAVVGAGPAGLSCAHRLALLGHQVVIFDSAPRAGGLNEYGIAAYKTVDDFAQREVQWILDVGGIDLCREVTIGDTVTLTTLLEEYDAVFLGMGLGSVSRLGIENEGIEGVVDAVNYIARLRQARDKSQMPVGRRIVVVGGGMTAIDIAVQSKLLGAESVDIVYRRGPGQMGASPYERRLAQTRGVRIHHYSQPSRILGESFVTGIEFERTSMDGQGELVATGELWTLEADVVFKAVGQILSDGLPESANEILEMHRGKISVTGDRRTSLQGLWAGGDCIAGGNDLTVTAVQDGKIAALSIDRHLRSTHRPPRARDLQTSGRGGSGERRHG